MSRLKNSLKATLIESRSGILVAIFTLLIAPVSLWVGFVLNAYLASASLEIEYVEKVEKTQAVVINTKIAQLNKQNPNQFAVLEAFPSFRLLEFNPVLGDEQADSIEAFLEARQKSLEELFETPSQALLQEIAKDYFLSGAASDEKSEAQEKIVMARNEAKVNALMLSDLSARRDAMNNALKEVFYKVSIHNRGQSDGLIRSLGAVVRANKVVSLVRARSPRSDPTSAVPVSISNPEIVDALSAASVGKIPSGSIVEFWFEEEEKIAPPEIPIEQNKQATVYLLDQDRNLVLWELE